MLMTRCSSSEFWDNSSPTSSCTPSHTDYVVAWHSGTVVWHINKVALHRARLVPRWVTLSEFCDAADCGGSSWYSVWCGLFNILSNSWSSASSNRCLKSGMSGGQKPHRLLRLRNASTPWRSVAVNFVVVVVKVLCSSTACDWTTGRKRSLI